MQTPELWNFGTTVVVVVYIYIYIYIYYIKKVFEINDLAITSFYVIFQTYSYGVPKSHHFPKKSEL